MSRERERDIYTSRIRDENFESIEFKKKKRKEKRFVKRFDDF